MGFRDYISGHKRKIQDPNWFGAGTVGGNWQAYLQDLYSKPTTETNQYRTMASALRDQLTMESGTMKDEFSDASNAGGFYDSGARLAGLSDINRNQIASYSQGMAQILTKLENDKMNAAFPFLQAQMHGWETYQNALYQQDELQTQRKKQIAQTFGSVMGGQMGGGQQTPQSTYQPTGGGGGGPYGT